MIAALPLSREHPENALQFSALGSLFDQGQGLFAREFEQVLVAQRVGDVKSQLSGLPRSEKLPRVAQLEVRFRDFEAVRGAHHGVEPRARFLSQDRKSTRLNSSHLVISYAVFCLKKKKKNKHVMYSITVHIVVRLIVYR